MCMMMFLTVIRHLKMELFIIRKMDMLEHFLTKKKLQCSSNIWTILPGKRKGSREYFFWHNWEIVGYSQLSKETSATAVNDDGEAVPVAGAIFIRCKNYGEHRVVYLDINGNRINSKSSSYKIKADDIDDEVTSGTRGFLKDNGAAILFSKSEDGRRGRLHRWIPNGPLAPVDYDLDSTVINNIEYLVDPLYRIANYAQTPKRL